MGIEFSRRGLVAGMGVLAAGPAAAAGSQITRDKPEEAVPGRVINICDPPYNADPSGQEDCAGILQAVFNELMSKNGGVVIVPPGVFALDFPVSSENHSVSILGAGPSLSVFAVRHSGVAITLNSYNTTQQLLVRDIGFSPTPNGGGAAGVALQLQYPDQNTGWPQALIENVDTGVARAGYTCFMEGLRLINCRRANFIGLNYHSNISPLPNATAVSLQGTCIDLHFDKCWFEGSGTGFRVESYCEGLTVSKSVIITNTAVDTGSGNYNNGINLLGLYISDCEFNCYETAANLFQVTTGWITSTHFGNKTVGLPAVQLTGCQSVQMSGCCLTGQYLPQSPSQFVGVTVAQSACCQVDNCLATNLLTGLVYVEGPVGCSATGLRMVAPGGSALIGAPVNVGGGLTIRAVLDESGNSDNFAQWVTSAGFMTSPSPPRVPRRLAENLLSGMR